MCQTYLVYVPAFRVEECEHVSPRHEALFEVAQLESVEWQHVLLLTLLLVLVPGDALRRQHEPVVAGASLKQIPINSDFKTLLENIFD